MENELQIFKNEELEMEIRTLMIEGEPYFVGKDVASVLGYAKPLNAIAKHVEEDDSLKWGLIDSLGRNQQTIVINESGLYSLILSSKLPQAKNFKRWVTSEVLPTIRKTGGYVNNDELFINTYLPFADDTTKSLFKGTLETVRKQNEVIAEQKKTIEHKEDVIIGLVDEIDLAQKRQVLVRVVKYKTKNYRERWNELYKQFEMKYHIDLKRRFNTYNENNKPKLKNKLDYIDKVLNKIPELYEIACKLYENDVKELVKEMYGIV